MAKSLIAIDFAGISREKKAIFLLFLIMLYIMLRAKAVLPIDGRAPIITYSSFAKPPLVYLSRTSKPVSILSISAVPSIFFVISSKVN